MRFASEVLQGDTVSGKSFREGWWQNLLQNWVCSSKSSISFELAVPSYIPLGGNGGYRDGGPNGLPNNGGHYPHWTGYGHGGHHSAPGGGDGCPPDDPYVAGSNSS